MADNDSSWNLLYGALIDGLGLDPSNFQLIYPFTSWNWESANVGYTTAAQYDFCSTLPQWSATGAYVSSGNRFATSYQNFLNVIRTDTSSPELQAEINAQQSVVQEAKNDYDIELSQAQIAYEQDTGGTNVPTFEEWLATLAGQSWKVAIDSKWTIYQAENEVLMSLQSQTETPGLEQANSNYLNQDYYTSYQDPNLVGYPPVPAWSISESASSWAVNAQAGNVGGGSLSFSNSDSSYDYQETWAGGSSSVGDFFWQVNANGEWREVTELEEDSSLSISINFQAWDTIAITGSFWYDGSFVNLHQDGPFNEGYSSDSFFGEGGSLNLLKTGMLVGYKPSFEITVSQSTYESFLEEWEASSGFKVGPFKLGGGEAGDTSESWTKSTSENTFSATSESEVPEIFGITLNQLPG